MYTLLKPLRVREELLQRNISVMTPQDFQRIFQTNDYQTKYFLEKFTRDGFLVRLKRGLYTLRTDPPAEEEIANLLYRPSYLSFEYALAKYNVIPEMAYSITSATTKPTRIFQALERTFTYLTVKREAFLGYIPVKRDEKTILLAELEKALVDYLYFVSLGKKTINDRLNLAPVDKHKAFKYAECFQRPGLVLLMKEIL